MINKRVLIAMVGTYLLQSLDKNVISYAAIMGIREDAHLVGQDVRIDVFLQLPRPMLLALVLMATHGYLLRYLIRRISDQYHCAKGSYWEVPRGEHLSVGLDLDYDLLRIQFQSLGRTASIGWYF
jgi:predicted DCC family thiol-disulfide oxidoreductase YuxK